MSDDNENEGREDRFERKVEEAREELNEILTMATQYSTMLIEELDKNPTLIENVEVLLTKYSGLVVTLAKPIVDYCSEKELAIAKAKFEAASKIFLDRHSRELDPQETVMLLAACFNRS